MSAPVPVFPAACVVDASVVVKFFVPEADSDLAIALLQATPGQPTPLRAVPDLLYPECGNVCWKLVRRGLLRAAIAATICANLVGLSLTVSSMAALLPAAFTLANTYGISVYDATYVALADVLQMPMITADGGLIGKVSGAGISVLDLASFR